MCGHGAKLRTLVDFVNRSGEISTDVTVHSDSIECMRNLCRHQGWDEPPRGFSVSPVNSPAALFHWRCLVVLLSALHSTKRDEFRTCGYVTVDNASTDPVVDSSLDEYTCIDVCYGSDVDIPNLQVDHTPRPSVDACERMAEIPSVVEAFDSHFHLNRTCSRIWKSSSGHSVEDLLRYAVEGQRRPNFEVTVCRGVVVYSEPANHPAASPDRGSFGLAISVHPKHSD